jgi:predicted peptidase
MGYLVAILGAFNVSAGQGWLREVGQHPLTFEKRIVKTIGAKFLLFLPKAFGQPEQKFPLILFLHGSGERGDDLAKVKKYGPPHVVEQQDDFPFIVLSPQCPPSERWSVDLVNALLDEALEQLPVDTERVYLTGLSMGGFGTWKLALAHPERFAAIAPVSGAGTLEDICRLKGMPIWIFHGAKDDIIPLSESQRMADALKRRGNDVKLTIYPEAGHDAWTETYANPELYTWFLQHTRRRQ